MSNLVYKLSGHLVLLVTRIKLLIPRSLIIFASIAVDLDNLNQSYSIVSGLKLNTLREN